MQNGLYLVSPPVPCFAFNPWNRVPVSVLPQTMQGSECLFEAVEQQDLDTVQILLYQFSADELDLNTPNSQGLTALDIAIMTNNTPIAKLLLKAGGKESPHCEYHPTHTHPYTVQYSSTSSTPLNLRG